MVVFVSVGNFFANDHASRGPLLSQARSKVLLSFRRRLKDIAYHTFYKNNNELFIPF